MLSLMLLLACGDPANSADDSTTSEPHNEHTSSEPLYDYGIICAESSADGATLEVFADSDDCSSDHEGVEFSCEVSVDGEVVTVTTTYVAGEDPDDGCAGPSTAACSADLPPGDYDLIFADEIWPIEVPLEQPLCIPDDGSTTGTTTETE